PREQRDSGKFFPVSMRHSKSLLALQNPVSGKADASTSARKWPEEGFTRPWPDMIEMTPAVKEKVDRMWARLGIEPLP
ncbi:MAG TPA: hypothetical protein VFS20_09790, partial [Longimicrobium sp.]|nr:hypothetical protein [Longimicrobium sp.]